MLGSIFCAKCKRQLPAYRDATFVICSCGYRNERPEVGPVMPPPVASSGSYKINAWDWVHQWLADESEPWDTAAAIAMYQAEFTPMIPQHGCVSKPLACARC